jgi:hypothetical protein
MPIEAPEDFIVGGGGIFAERIPEPESHSGGDQLADAPKSFE